MTAVEINRELAALRRRVDACEQQRVRFAAERDRALAVEPARFRQVDVDAAMDAISRVAQERANLDERIAALERQLPSSHDVRQAEEQVRALAAEATRAQVRFAAEWADFMERIDAVEAAGRVVAATYGEHRAASGRIQDLANQFALDVPTPAAPRPDRSEMKLAGLVGVLITDIGFHLTVDGTTDRDLSGARTERDRRAGTALASRV